MEPNTWAMLCHLSGLLGYLGNFVGSMVGPLVVWLIKKDELALVDQHGKEALNFNISVGIYFLILIAATVLTLGVAFVLTVPLMIALTIFHVVCVIVATLKASRGEAYRYPMCMRIVS